MDIKKILKEMIARGASDLHLKVATPPCFRINGTLVYGEYEPPTIQDMAACPPGQPGLRPGNRGPRARHRCR